MSLLVGKELRLTFKTFSWRKVKCTDPLKGIFSPLFYPVAIRLKWLKWLFFIPVLITNMRNSLSMYWYDLFGKYSTAFLSHSQKKKKKKRTATEICITITWYLHNYYYIRIQLLYWSFILVNALSSGLNSTDDKLMAFSYSYVCSVWRMCMKDWYMFTVFNLITAHTPISAQSCNLVGFRLQSMLYYLFLYILKGKRNAG